MAAVEVEIVYQGDLHTQAVHGPSGETLRTDAPVDNEGRGELFSPTDLVGTSMGTCMLTIMGIAARRRGIELEPARCRVRKHMVHDPVRRIGKLELEFQMPMAIDPRQRQVLERAADTCPVRASLHPDVRVEVSFRYSL